jgi:NADPH-dependent curcumin reductase CurA
MSLPTQTKQWVLAHKPIGYPVLEGDNATFELVTKDLPQLKDGQVLVQTLYLSNDPAQRYGGRYFALSTEH